MSAVVNRIRRTFYMDSVALMRISRAVSSLAGVETAALMIGSTTNKKLMRDAGLLNGDSDSAGPNDLIIAVRADNEASGDRGRSKKPKNCSMLPRSRARQYERMESENAGDGAATASGRQHRADLGAR